MPKTPLKPMVPQFKPPDPFTFPDKDRPVSAIIREVNISSNSRKISTKFSRANAVEDVSDPQRLKKLFIAIATGKYSFPHKIDPKPKKKFKSPLSLNNSGYHYIIYILKRKKNWQFSSNYSPITIGTDPAALGKYYEAAHIYDNGKLKNPPKAECIAAYFIAKAPKSGTEYIDNINLHVDLIYKDHTGEKSFMPLIIDPDVRFPGGSGEP